MTGPFTEAGLRTEVWPLFAKALARPGIYLANHSLGRPLDAVSSDLGEFESTWTERLDDAWDAWTEEAREFCAGTERLIGASHGTVTPKTSAGQGLRAVLNATPTDRPLRVVTTAGEFDSVDFILRTYAHAGRIDLEVVHPSASLQGVPLYGASDLLGPPDADLVVVSLVMFETGQIFPDLAEVIRNWHSRGAKVLVDVYHGAGAIPMSVDELDADFAIGGSYKYLRGGPGASWLYVHPRNQGMPTLDTGWFAKADAFRFSRGSRRATGIAGWAESTPAVVALYQCRSGLRFTLEAGVDRLRAYSLERQELLREQLARADAPVFHPLDPSGFGAFSLVACDDAEALVESLRDAGITVDARGRFVRFCPDILNSEVEFEAVGEAMCRLKVRA